MDLNHINKNKFIQNENGINGQIILKDLLSKTIFESLSHTQAYINNNIITKLDIMEKRLNNLGNKILKLKNNTTNKSNINLESKINIIWLKCLELIGKNKIEEAYDLMVSSKDDIYLLRLVCLTGPVLHLLNEELAKKILVRINMINRGKQISDILLNLVEESIDNKNNIFKKLEYSEQNDIIDSLFNMFKNRKNNNLSIKAQNLYNIIVENSKKDKV